MAVDNFYNTTRGILSNDNINGITKISELGGAFQNAWKDSKSGWGTMGAGLLQGAGSMIGNKYGEDYSEEQKARQAGFRNIAGMFGPWGQALALLDGAAAGLATATGTALSNVDPNSANMLGLKSVAKTNDALNSTGLTSLIFGATGGRTRGFGVSDAAEEMESGYGSTLAQLRAGGEFGNKRVAAWQLNKVNSVLDELAEKDRIIQDIYDVNTMRKNSNYDQNLQHQWQNRIAGQNYLSYAVGKNGMKLMSIEEAKRILANRKEEQIEKFQNGGVVGIDTNVIPEGALHARKNNLAEINPDLEDATKKGIPVMAVQESDLEQVAEIENSEIIFRLEVTQQLEELMKDGSEEATIEAGKLVANELIENTQDNVGAIESEVDNGK